MWRHRSTKPDSRSETEEVRAARKAAERAECERRRAEEAEPRARRTGGQIRKELGSNHFGEMLDNAMARRPK